MTQQDRIHGLDHINHAEVHRFEFGEVRFVDGDAVRQADAGGADVSLEAVVNGVSVLVERCSLHHGVLSLSQAASACWGTSKP